MLDKLYGWKKTLAYVIASFVPTHYLSHEVKGYYSVNNIPCLFFPCYFA